MFHHLIELFLSMREKSIFSCYEAFALFVEFIVFSQKLSSVSTVILNCSSNIEDLALDSDLTLEVFSLHMR